MQIILIQNLHFFRFLKVVERFQSGKFLVQTNLHFGRDNKKQLIVELGMIRKFDIQKKYNNSVNKPLKSADPNLWSENVLQKDFRLIKRRIFSYSRYHSFPSATSKLSVCKTFISRKPVGYKIIVNILTDDPRALCKQEPYTLKMNNALMQ